MTGRPASVAGHGSENVARSRPTGQLMNESAALKTVEVWVQGQRFEIRTDADQDAAAKVARYVNDKIGEASSLCGQVPRVNIAVLAVLNLAQEHLALLEEHRRLREAVEEKARLLVGKIEKVLK